VLSRAPAARGSWGAYAARGVIARRPRQVSGAALLVPLIIAAHAEQDHPDHRVSRERRAA
jgi:hypothetical protein